MISSLKEVTRTRILEAARKEFFRLGFEEANMREIADLAQVSTSNIYNYFQNKEHLLSEILSPILKGLEVGFQYISQPNYLAKRLADSFEDWRERFDLLLNYIASNREDFQLLLLKTKGSELEGLEEKTKLRASKIYIEHFHSYARDNPEYRGQFSEFVIHNLVSFFLNIFIEMIRQDRTVEEMERDKEMLLKFLHSGFRGAMESNSEAK